MRRLLIPFVAAVACLAQANWQAITNLPRVDWKTLTGAKKQRALRMMQAEPCSCGCSMKVAECRVKDPTCDVSLKTAKIVVQDVADGKNAQAVQDHVKQVLSEPPPVFEDAVKISTAGDPARGPETARLTIIEFSDFQCPYCSKVVGQVNQVLKQFPKDIRFVYKQFPLEMHSEAEFASEASLAAQAQGKFWEMHDLIYAGFPDINRARVLGYAKKLNLDTKRFISELDSHKYRGRVLAEQQEGAAARVSGTPSFFFNGKRLNRTFDVATVVPLVRKELK